MNELDTIGTMIDGAVLAGTIEAERAPGRDGIPMSITASTAPRR